MTLKTYTDVKVKNLQLGSHTNIETALVPFGGFSTVFNMRGMHPGFQKRMGQRKLNSTADGTNKVLSLYHFNKTRVDDSHFYAQMSDGDVLEYSSTPPTTVTGTFGSTVFTSASGSQQIAASWSNLGDKMLFSNGYDQHKIYGGLGSYVDKFVVYKGAGTIPIVPELGEDYSDYILDPRTTYYATVSGLSTIAAFDCIFVRTPTQASGIIFDIITPNTTSATMDVRHNVDGTWTSVAGLVNGTVVSGVPFAQDGTISWTPPTDTDPRYLYASNGWWYQICLTAGSLSNCTINTVKYNGFWTNIKNVWDGVPQDGIEVQVYDGTNYSVYGAGAINVSEMTSSWRVYIACADPVIGFYIDPGTVPSLSAATINAVYYWNGSAWVAVTGLADGTTGMTEPGWVTFRKPTIVPQPQQFRGTQYYAYWYYFTVSSSASEDTNIGIQYMPYYNIDELGYSYTNEVWKDRVLYSFDKWGEYIYVSQSNSPEVLNGNDYGILEAGDGRSHSIVAMRKFYNELLVWQEEKGSEGGCLTLFEGYSPVTFGKLLLSSKVGAMNNKSVVVVDGVLTSTATDERIKTLAFFLSRYGVGVTDGKTVSMISDNIANYFDPTDTVNCIRRGYEKDMWLNYDSAYNVLRIGLVTGPTATVCNTFPVFDLVDKCWYFDTPRQELNCMTEVGATSGNVPILQYAGGVDDGTVYQLNYSNNDYNYPIDAYIVQEFDGKGEVIQLREIVIRTKAETTGMLRFTVYDNGVEVVNKNLTLQPEASDETMRRHRENLNVLSKHISIKYQNDEIFRTCVIDDVGVQIKGWLNE